MRCCLHRNTATVEYVDFLYAALHNVPRRACAHAFCQVDDETKFITESNTSQLRSYSVWLMPMTSYQTAIKMSSQTSCLVRGPASRKWFRTVRVNILLKSEMQYVVEDAVTVDDWTGCTDGAGFVLMNFWEKKMIYMSCIDDVLMLNNSDFHEYPIITWTWFVLPCVCICSWKLTNLGKL